MPITLTVRDESVGGPTNEHSLEFLGDRMTCTFWDFGTWASREAARLVPQRLTV